MKRKGIKAVLAAVLLAAPLSAEAGLQITSANGTFNITAEAFLTTWTASQDYRVETRVYMSGLNASAETLTPTLYLMNSSGTVLLSSFFSDVKRNTTDTVYGTVFAPITVLNGEKLKVSMLGSGTSTAAVTTIQFMDASMIDSPTTGNGSILVANGGTLNVTGIVNSGSLSTGSLNVAGIINTGSISSGSLSITNVLSAGSISAAGANTLGTLTIANAGIGTTTAAAGAAWINGTLATATSLTNAPTNGDLTATMKTSITTAATAATPTVVLNTSQGAVTFAALASTGSFNIGGFNDGGTFNVAGAGTFASTLNAGSTTVASFVSTNGLSAGSILSTGSLNVGGFNDGFGFNVAGITTLTLGLQTTTIGIGTLTALNVGFGTTTPATGAAYFNGTLSTLTTYTGNTPQTGDSFARLGAPSGASIDADILTRLATSAYTAPPSAAAIATTVWQDMTAGDFTIQLSPGFRLKKLANGAGIP